MGLELRWQGESVELDVRVSPRASRDRIQGEHAGALKVSLSAPPVEGAANDALVATLARALGVPRASVQIVRGQRSRTKTVRVSGVTPEAVRALAGDRGLDA